MSETLRNEELLTALEGIVGKSHVLTAPSTMRRFCTGFRGGTGAALAVVRPGSLVEMWHVLERCIAGRKALIMQGANTGLTGGSTPAESGYDRDVVVISGMRINRIFVIDDGRQAICLPGVTLAQLERALASFGREPHSVLGSSCFGASVIGGICNNSGGSLVRRGPAYTEMALFAQVSQTWQLRLVNHLGVSLGEAPEEALARLDRGEFAVLDQSDVLRRHGSDAGYAARIRNVESREPLRYNEDRGRLFEASGCAGKLAVFAVRVDTFAKDEETRVFYIGTNDPAALYGMRRGILTQFQSLPISAEYIHRTAFDLAERYGKEIFLAIRFLGTGAVPTLRYLQDKMDFIRGTIRRARTGRGRSILHTIARALPSHLPQRMMAFRERFEHHLLLKMAGAGIDEARGYLQKETSSGACDVFECTKEEAERAFLHRFVVAGAAMRFQQVQRLGITKVVSLDVALRPDDADWRVFEPETVRPEIYATVCYGHFLCYVFHLEYIVRPGGDAVAVKERLQAWLDERGARYPAEHNVGRSYQAGPDLVEFYKALDPTNSFNPGVGQTSMKVAWR